MRWGGLEASRIPSAAWANAQRAEIHRSIRQEREVVAGARRHWCWNLLVSFPCGFTTLGLLLRNGHP